MKRSPQKSYTLKDLKKEAKLLGLKGYSKDNKQSLMNKIDVLKNGKMINNKIMASYNEQEVLAALKPKTPPSGRSFDTLFTVDNQQTGETYKIEFKSVSIADAVLKAHHQLNRTYELGRISLGYDGSEGSYL